MRPNFMVRFSRPLASPPPRRRRSDRARAGVTSGPKRTYVWSAEIVSFDTSAKTMTARAAVHRGGCEIPRSVQTGTAHHAGLDGRQHGARNRTGPLHRDLRRDERPRTSTRDTSCRWSSSRLTPLHGRSRSRRLCRQTRSRRWPRSSRTFDRGDHTDGSTFRDGGDRRRLRSDRSQPAPPKKSSETPQESSGRRRPGPDGRRPGFWVCWCDVGSRRTRIRHLSRSRLRPCRAGHIWFGGRPSAVGRCCHSPRRRRAPRLSRSSRSASGAPASPNTIFAARIQRRSSLTRSWACS